MNSLINLFKNNNRNKNVIITITIILVMTVIILITVHCSSTKKTNTNTVDTNDEFYTFKESDLANIVSGIDDMTVLVDSRDIDYMCNVIYNEDIVKSIDVNDSKVDLTKVGEYKIVYKITVINKKLNKYLNKSIKSSAKETSLININHKVTVVSLEDAQALADNNVAVYTNKDSTMTKSDGSSISISNTSTTNNKNMTNNATNKDNSSSKGSTSGSGNSNSSSGNGGSGNNSSSDTPAKHEHSWTAITNTVRHEATGHYETQVVQAAYDEPIYESRSICNGCGADITNNIEHIFECDPGSYSNKKVQVGTKHHEAVTKQVWVQDSAAWDETVTTGHKCSGCGKTK